MMRGLDFSSWQSILTTILGILLVTLIGMGIRLVMMFTIQQRRERMNRQINERLRTLIAAYKALDGSFTGNLAVDPSHLRDLRKREQFLEGGAEAGLVLDPEEEPRNGAGSDRSRRIRDIVEAALSDIILLGTEEHVRLAERAARELVAGRPVHTHDLVVSLRAFIRKALDLDPIPADLAIPAQGPARPSGSGGTGRGGQRGREEGQGGQGGRGGGGTAGAGMGAGMGAGFGLGVGAGHPASEDEAPPGR